MNILITGGAGFIGSNLADKLLEQGHDVFIVDDLSTGRQENIDWINSRSAPAWGVWGRHLCVDISKSFRSQRHGLSLRSQIDSYLQGKKIDQIYHLACPASPPKYYKNPLKTLDINYIGTKNVLEVAKKHKARILFTSTSEIYGDPLDHPQPETYNGNVDPISPRSVYDEGKRVAETLVSQYHRTYGLETKIARVFNTYGPRMDPDDGRVVTNFIKQALNRNLPEIYGDGQQTRSFCYVDDQVSGLIILMNSNEFINEPVNIGNNHEIKIIELLNEICYQIFKKDENCAVHKDLPVSDPKRRCPDLAKMKSIGWHPQIQLREGIQKTIQYIKEELNEKD